MKKISFVLAMLAVVLVFGLAFVSCDDGSGSTGNVGNTQGGSGGSGTLAVTGIPSKYNGKYAIFQGYEVTEVAWGSIAGDVWVVGCQSYNNSTGVATLVQIVNGSVSLPMWIQTNSGQFVRYSGNHTGEFQVPIENFATLGDGPEDTLNEIVFDSITFSNGSATRSWSQGKVWIDD